MNRDRLTLRAVFRRVVQKIEDDLRQPLAIAKGDTFATWFEAQVLSNRIDDRLKTATCLGKKSAQFDRFEACAPLLATMGEGQQILNEPRQSSRLLIDKCHRTQHFRP